MMPQSPPFDSEFSVTDRFAVVAVGASAGGLEPMEQFFGACGSIRQCAFVVIQHLSPSQPSLLPELLQRGTPLTVRTIEHGQRPLPGHVHVAPPGCDLRIANGVFELSPSADGHRAHHPIDTFFESLAQALGERAIGVILSGMGSDGTAGLRALKSRSGGTFAQAPVGAQFDSMPRSAIQANLVAEIAEPDKLPQRIAAYLIGSRTQRVSAGGPAQGVPAIDAIVRVLIARTGQDFSRYKKSTVQRRIERRMALHQEHSYESYARLLAENTGEADLLFKELLIGVTSFFRDPPVWEQLERELIPQLLARHRPDTDLRIWIAACSTGEEVYTLAILLVEAIQRLQLDKPPRIRIFATDIDKDAIARARSARYPASIAVDISSERLERFFIEDQYGYQVRKEVRECVIFAVQNVAMDPPFTKLDMLVCRNLLIYFEPELQRRLLPLFHYSLEPDGLLMLGTAETVGPTSDYFEPVADKSKVFRRVESFRRSGFVGFPAAFVHPRRHETMAKDNQIEPPGNGQQNLQALADHILLQRYSPAAVLVTNDGDVLYISGKTGRYLEPAAGKANWNVLAMAREGLRTGLSNAMREALQGRRVVIFQGIVVDADAGPYPVRVTVDPTATPGAASGMLMIVFNDIDGRIAQVPSATEPHGAAPAHQELIQMREALRAAREDAQSAEEQSRAASEELQSTNEELQSTNEELTTSKEEMQSMNEELQTVNQELQGKLDELTQASDDMRNLLNSTDIATLFLDDALRIRRFTSQATTIFKLIVGDVGRPITDITNDLADWALAEDARMVLDSLVFRERDVAASGDRWFKVRTMPYRTFQNRIDGVVITFSDITRAKRLELELQAAKHALEDRLAEGDPGARIDQ